MQSQFKNMQDIVLGSKIFYIYILLVLISSGNAKKQECSWAPWSECSSTCGEGSQIRHRYSSSCLEEINKQQKPCFLMFCPSYLSWPRLHFSGLFVADVNTINNNRCAYDNDHFTPTKQTKDYIGLANMTTTHMKFTKTTGNWNPDGSNHVYFSETKITSVCLSPRKCTTKSKIVGAHVTDITRGVMACLDPDWQMATEIWGLSISIPEVLSADYVHASVQMEIDRCKLQNQDKGYALCRMGRYKSKLINIQWHDSFYKKAFQSATELSINFVVDMYNQITLEGRITGTIGLTSSDDPMQMPATRVLQPIYWPNSGPAPFFVHKNLRLLTVDLGFALQSDHDGIFKSTSFGCLDLFIEVKTKVYCRYFYDHRKCIFNNTPSQLINYRLTDQCLVSNLIGSNNDWYEIYGGVLDIDLRKLSHNEMKLIMSSRVVLMRDSRIIIIKEAESGMNIGFNKEFVHRVEVGQDKLVSVFVSSFGRPMTDWLISFDTSTAFKGALCDIPKCNTTLGAPKSAITFVPAVSTTDFHGVATTHIRGVHDPGNPRGCYLDGQIYPYIIIARKQYKANRKMATYTSGAYIPVATTISSRKLYTADSAIKLYDVTQMVVDPTWEDVKNIFIQYSNLYTVMSKNDIVQLHSYENLKRRSKLLKAAMFETSFNDTRYMPNTRDLSQGKLELIRAWMENGMKKGNMKESETCNHNLMIKRLEELRTLLQSAVILELSTIPPYVTAWLSLKTEYGRNKEVAKILKSVFVEEMLHMTLAANILNAIGGNVTLNKISLLPEYPSNLMSGNFYQIAPPMRVSIEPASIGLFRDVFSSIEKPVDKQRKGDLSETSEENNNEESKTKIHSWRLLKEVGHVNLHEMKNHSSTNIGSFYIDISLRMTWLESCAKITNFTSPDLPGSFGTIFVKNLTKQLSMDQWYNPSSEDEIEKTLEMVVEEENYSSTDLRTPLFPVFDLKTALRAILEIIDQGEGCSNKKPFDTYLFGQTSPELSHYYRFQEIVFGRKLALVTETEADFFHPSCIKFIDSSKNKYCYVGKDIPFSSDGVWPIVSDPHDHMYHKNTTAYRLNKRFNTEYTRLLLCLQRTFNGNPNQMCSCMGIMYNMVMAGKKLVRTPIGPLQNTKDIKFSVLGTNASPTWKFQRELTEISGLAIRVT